VRLAIALAFADASVAVLALPQIVIRLHTSISHVTWVITAYNLALIATTIAIVPFASRLANRRTLVAGLALFGLASLGSGAATSLAILVVWRCLQGAGGALFVCASLPLFSAQSRAGSGSLHGWAATAALGAGLGPAAGGLLTQLFDWRAIFFAQAPVAAAAALASLAVAGRATAGGRGSQQATAPRAPTRWRGSLAPRMANIALAFVSAGLIGALFLATVLLIDVWQISPLGAAAILLVIPLATALTDRATRGRPARPTAAAGAILLAAGLGGLALLTHRELVLATLALAGCGAGLGLSFPSLTRVALETSGPVVGRAARTVAAREGGLVIGLVLLTPVLVNQLDAAPGHAIPKITRTLIFAPVSLATKFELGAGLAQANAKAPASQLPDIGPPFARVESGATASTRSALQTLRAQVQALIVRAVTAGFRKPLGLCALLTLLALAPLTVGGVRRRAPPAT
jgi:predicted MFS family arabinose efflux permease